MSITTIILVSIILIYIIGGGRLLNKYALHIEVLRGEIEEKNKEINHLNKIIERNKRRNKKTIKQNK